MKLLRFTLLLLPLLLSACSHELSGGSVNGRVLEAGSLQPVAGAIVAVLWEGHLAISWVDGQTVCYHVETATTDKTGKYYIPAWTEQAEDWRTDVSDKYLYSAAYHRDYEFAKTPSQKKESLYLDAFQGTAAERLEFLSRLLEGTRCDAKYTSEKNLYPFYNAIYQEAKILAVTQKDGGILESMLFSVEVAKFGFEIADRNQLKRIGGPNEESDNRYRINYALW